MISLPEANAKFALDFLHQLSEEHPSDNLLFSPVNLSTGLGLTLYGSGSNTAAELEKVLHWDEFKEGERLRNKRYLVTRIMSSGSSVKFQEKDKLYPRQHFHPVPLQNKSWDHRLHAPKPLYPKPCDSRRQAPKPEHARPYDDRRQGLRHPPPLSKPEASACPRGCVSDYECESPEGVHTAFSKILTELNKPSTNYFLSFANKLYGDYAVDFIQKFIFCALKLYLTEVGRADFQNAPEDVRRLINLWVEIQSHGEIKDLLSKDSLDSLTKLLMVNTMYFKGLWEIQFNKELTEEAPFHANEKASHSVLLMNTRGTFNTGTVHLGNVGVQVLEIPYTNHEMSMFILLPKDRSPDSILQLEDALTHAELLDWSNDLKPEEVEVAIPKFSIEKTFLAFLNDHETGDFSGAITTQGLALTQLVHDTFFEVDEEGGEEPASKAAGISGRPRRGPVQFVADHPFFFYVLHKRTQSIIVFGRFSKPE